MNASGDAYSAASNSPLKMNIFLAMPGESSQRITPVLAPPVPHNENAIVFYLSR
jgi:hypothetical protein